MLEDVDSNMGDGCLDDVSSDDDDVMSDVDSGYGSAGDEMKVDDSLILGTDLLVQSLAALTVGCRAKIVTGSASVHSPSCQPTGDGFVSEMEYDATGPAEYQHTGSTQSTGVQWESSMTTDSMDVDSHSADVEDDTVMDDAPPAVVYTALAPPKAASFHPGLFHAAGPVPAPAQNIPRPAATATAVPPAPLATVSQPPAPKTSATSASGTMLAVAEKPSTASSPPPSVTQLQSAGFDSTLYSASTTVRSANFGGQGPASAAAAATSTAATSCLAGQAVVLAETQQLSPPAPTTTSPKAPIVPPAPHAPDASSISSAQPGPRTNAANNPQQAFHRQEVALEVHRYATTPTLAPYQQPWKAAQQIRTPSSCLASSSTTQSAPETDPPRSQSATHTPVMPDFASPTHSGLQRVLIQPSPRAHRLHRLRKPALLPCLLPLSMHRLMDCHCLARRLQTRWESGRPMLHEKCMRPSISVTLDHPATPRPETKASKRLPVCARKRC